jgi:hypothetical protein
MAERDRAAGRISELDRDHFLRATDALMNEAFDAHGGHTPPPIVTSGSTGVLRVLGVPARNAADELLWKMIVHMFNGRAVVAETVPAVALASEVGVAAERLRPHLVCITSVPPGGLAHARYLCKRLRARLPDVPILVVRPSPGHEASAEPEADGARVTATTVDGGLGVSTAASLAQVASRAEQLLIT